MANLRKNASMNKIEEQDYFPKGLATGEAFCDREDERSILKQNIIKCNHTLIKSPRRYGKTSLVCQSVLEVGLPYGEADLFVTVNAKHAEQQILKAAKSIIKQVCSPIEQGIQIIKKYLSNSSSRWTIGTKGIDMALIPDEGSNTSNNILDVLTALEGLLQEKDTKAIIFIDEIQDLSNLPEARALEGAIRHVAQKSKKIVFIFSGSNRHLLTNMFEDSARPLYKLCDKIILTRIKEEHYRKHLDSFSQKKWGKNINEESFSSIGKHTEWHPYYVNLLCSKLWGRKDTPKVVDIVDSWKALVQADRVDVIQSLNSLSMGQQKVLIKIAMGYGSELTGKTFLKEVGLSGSSVSEAVTILEQQDYIQKDNKKYGLIDPLIKSAIKMSYTDN